MTHIELEINEEKRSKCGRVARGKARSMNMVWMQQTRERDMAKK